MFLLQNLHVEAVEGVVYAENVHARLLLEGEFKREFRAPREGCVGGVLWGVDVEYPRCRV